MVFRFRRKFSIVVAYCAGDSFRSWWWRSVSSPLQVSGAVTRLTVDRAAPHNLTCRGEDTTLRRGYYSVSNITCRGEDTTLKVKTKRGHLRKKLLCNLGETSGEFFNLAWNSAIRFHSGLKSGVLCGVTEISWKSQVDWNILGIEKSGAS